MPMRKFYLSMTVFLTVATWLSCVSVIKSQTKIPFTTGALASVPQNIPFGHILPPIETSTPSHKKVPETVVQKPVRFDLSRDLRECRVILDTVNNLHENTLAKMSQTVDEQH